MKKSIRNRIIEHVQIRAGDLVPHPLNFRRHSSAQRAALAASYDEVGFARSLLGYRLDDGRIQLIDGHLRRDLDPDMLVTVEVLNVTNEEARKLLLTLDPLAALADSDDEMLAKLTASTQAESQELNDLWQSLLKEKPDLPTPDEEPPSLPEQYLILVQCRDEAHQAELLARFDAEGIACKPLMS